jgi:hypothetical protein
VRERSRFIKHFDRSFAPTNRLRTEGTDALPDVTAFRTRGALPTLRAARATRSVIT